MSDSEFVIKGGQIVADRGLIKKDVLISGDSIKAVEDEIDHGQILDGQGCLIAPGLVDLHTHLRQPGQEESETIETGSRAGALGGFTALVAMPNTNPSIDCASVIRDIQEIARESLIHIGIAGAITVGREGNSLAPIAEMASLGVRLFTDDGRGVQDNGLMRRALEYASDLNVTLAQHCEVEDLAVGGHMNESDLSAQLGIQGIPALAEELMVMRDIELAFLTGTAVHFQHLSTKGSVELVKNARKRGIAVTSEAAPHHFTLSEAEVSSFNPVYKVNPPLRQDEDIASIKEGLQTGAIDAIATDHAPHEPHLKDLPFDEAPPGMLGLETAFSLALSELDMSINEVIEIMSKKPARIAGLKDQGVDIVAGNKANLIVFDPSEKWVVDADNLSSLSRNTPYAGREMTGKVRHTIYYGEVVVCNGKAVR